MAKRMHVGDLRSHSCGLESVLNESGMGMPSGLAGQTDRQSFPHAPSSHDERSE